MSPLVRKEIRLLFPYWGIAMLLVVIPPLALARDPHDLLNESFFWVFGFGMVLLGLAPFGYEFSAGTFSSLMVQPMERRRIWRFKILLTGLAALLVLVAFESVLYWRTSLHLRDLTQDFFVKMRVSGARFDEWQARERNLTWVNFWHTSGTITVLLFVAITGGLWTTLLFRQTGAALWFVILIPGAISVALVPVFHFFDSSDTQATISFVTFALYSVAGFMWARRMFATAEDYQWLGESIAVFDLKSTKVHEDSAAPRRRGAIRALVRKEIQSHQISLLIAFGLLVMHICSLVFRGVYVLPPNSEFRFVVEATPFLWLLVPWLVGSVAIAEERKLGTMESQLCLPVSRRIQFTIKLIIALLLGLVLGGIIPCVIEWIGLRFHISSEVLGLVLQRQSHEFSRLPGGGLAGMGAVVAFCTSATLISLVSFFASSLTRNTLHALGTAIVFGFAWIFLYRALFFEFDQSWWQGQLIFLISIPVAIVATIALSFSNYKTLHAGHNVWLRNVVVLCITMVCAGIATAVIYQRPWELIVSVEPRHGAPVLDGPVQPMVCMPEGKIFALLPDGRIWTATDYHIQELNYYTQNWDPNSQQYNKEKVRVELPTSGTFITGSNWTATANASGRHIAGLRSDGTLWEFVVQSSDNAHHHSDWLSGTPEPRRVGSDSDWKAVAAGQNSFYAIKSNGTLWGWGENELGDVAPNSRPYFGEPVQVGTNSDWSRFFSVEYGALVMKTNGDLWSWHHENKFRLEFGHFGFFGLNGADWLSVGGEFGPELIIHQDGTLWANPRYLGTHRYFGVRIPSGTTSRQVRVESGSGWLRIIGRRPNLYAIKKDGRLVKDSTELFSSFLGQPSRYSDWLAADAQWSQMVALAADGTVCEWVDGRSWGPDGSLLAPTRRPIWSMNILKDSKN